MADIDFANSDSRMKFLQENLGHLMNGIDQNYGHVLMDELMRRLEMTVSEFNDEVKVMLDRLQEKEAKAEDSPLETSPFASNDSPQPAKDINLKVEGLSEFEKRLESLDS
jgi:hypothetical protein